MTAVFIRRGVEGEDGSVTTETEIAVMHSETKNCQGLPIMPEKKKKQG